MFKEYAEHDAIGLAELIERGEVTPDEVLEAAIARAEAANPKLNAIVTPLYDYARRRVRAGGLSGPFAYVPFVLKDVHHALQGTPMSNASKLQQGEVSKENAEIVQRWLDAGLVVIGKTNTPEYKLSTSTNNAPWGRTLNPWDVGRTPGGSSGGSAAAVAAGIVPAASATDEAGSIRIPASCCGVFGLKPSRGRNPIGPDMSWELEGLSTSHVITRSVRDCAALLDATCGPEAGSPYVAPGETGFLHALTGNCGKLKVAVCTERNVCGSPMDEACVDAIVDAAKLLQRLGHHVDEVRLPFSEEEALRLSSLLIAGNTAAFVAGLREKYGSHRVKKDVDVFIRMVAKAGGALSAADMAEARLRARAMGQQLARFHQKYDVLVISTIGRVPVPNDAADPTAGERRLSTILETPLSTPFFSIRPAYDKLFDELVRGIESRIKHRTSVANLTGQPAMSVPLYWTDDDLPVGVQFIGRLGDEALLLQLAAQLEEAQPWAAKRPPL